jgi:hypothetical protein
MWTKDQKIAVASIGVAIVTVVISFFQPDVRKCLGLDPGGCSLFEGNSNSPTTSPSSPPSGKETNTPDPQPTRLYAVIVEGKATDLKDLKKRPKQALGQDWRRNELYKNMQICSDSQGLYYLVAGSDLNESESDNLLQDAKSNFREDSYKRETKLVPYNSGSCNSEF